MSPLPSPEGVGQMQSPLGMSEVVFMANLMEDS